MGSYGASPQSIVRNTNFYAFLRPCSHGSWSPAWDAHLDTETVALWKYITDERSTAWNIDHK